MKKRFLLVPLAMSAAAVWACSPVAQGNGDGDGDINPGDGDIDPGLGDGDIDPGGKVLSAWFIPAISRAQPWTTTPILVSATKPQLGSPVVLVAILQALMEQR